MKEVSRSGGKESRSSRFVFPLMFAFYAGHIDSLPRACAELVSAPLWGLPHRTWKQCNVEASDRSELVLIEEFDAVTLKSSEDASMHFQAVGPIEP